MHKRSILISISFALYFILFSLTFTVPAYAYIDPSAVTYVFQAVAGVVIAIGACLTIFRHKIAAFFKKKKQENKKEVHFKDTDSEEAQE